MDGIAIGLGIALFGWFLGTGLDKLGRHVCGAAASLSSEWRFYTKVLGRFEMPPAPPPPPVDPRAKTMEEWLLRRTDLSEEEREDLLGMYEGVAGLRPAGEHQVQAWRRRLSAIGAPVPS